MKIKLTEQERALIVAGGFLPANLLALIQSVDASGDRFRRFTVTLDDKQMHEAREALINQLQAVGFDNDDEPTPDGRILEGLINKFCPIEKG